MFGLNDSDINYIIETIKSFPEIEKALVFGSRAKGNYKSGSDVDVAIYGEGVNFNTVSSLKALLEDQGPLPYFFDVIDYTHLKNEEIKGHIDRAGKVIFERE